MANLNYLELTAGTVKDTDVHCAVDITDSSMDPTGTNKKYNWSALKADVLADVPAAGDVSSSIGVSNNNYFVVFDGTTGKLIKQTETIKPPLSTGPGPFGSGAYFLYASDTSGNISYAALPFYATTSFATTTSIEPFGAAQNVTVFCQKVGLIVTIYITGVSSITTSSSTISLNDPIPVLPVNFRPPTGISRQIEMLVGGRSSVGVVSISTDGFIEIGAKKVVVDDLVSNYNFPISASETGWSEIMIQYFVNSY